MVSVRRCVGCFGRILADGVQLVVALQDVTPIVGGPDSDELAPHRFGICVMD